MASRNTRLGSFAAVAAAVGFYLYDRNHSEFMKSYTGTGRTLSGNTIVKVKEEIRSLENPKLAPQFDGLDCFETLVAS